MATDSMPSVSRRRLLFSGVSAGILASVAGCAGFPGFEPLRVNIVGLERLEGEGFELRLAVKLRVQNPNNNDMSFDGVVLDLDVNGRPLASGVSDQKGVVPRFGQVVLTVPVSVNAISAVRQLLGLAEGMPRTELPYAARGSLGGGVPGGMRFSAEGVLKLPQ